MMRAKALSVFFSAMTLSGCMATLQSPVDNAAGSGQTLNTKAEKNEELALLDRSDKERVQWDASLLRKAETVFVPAVFSATSKGQLYVNGQLVLFNNNPQADVLGFIQGPKKNSYLVAVASPRKLVKVDNRSGGGLPALDPEVLKKLSPQEQLRMMEAAAALQRSQAVVAPAANTQSVSSSGFYVAIYEVDSAGKTTRELTGFETATPQAWVGKDGIFVATPVSGRSGSFNYQGYNSKGVSVAGPTNVRWASPSVTPGSWYFYRAEPTQARNAFQTHTIFEWGMWSAAEGFKVDSNASIRLQSYLEFVNTSAIFVNEVPLADTARTGAATYIHAEGNSEAVKFQFIDAYIHVYKFGAAKLKKEQIDCFGLCNRQIELASHKFIKAASSKNWSAEEAGRSAAFFAKRGFLTGKDDSLLYFNQNETGAFGSLVFGGMTTLDKDVPMLVLDEINGVGLNNARKFLFAAAGNSDVFSKNKNAFGIPFFVAGSEKPLVMMNSRLDKEVVGIDLNGEKLVTGAGYSDTASQFGISLR